MKIERYQPRRQGTSPVLLGCGCLGLGGIGIVITAIVAMTIFPMLPSLVLSNFGLQEIGDTSEILNAPVPTIPALMDVQTVGSVTLNTGSYSQTLSGAGTGYSIVIGDTESEMQRQMQVSFTEAGLLEQCQEISSICSTTGDRMRNASFDLRAGGLVINAEFEVSAGIWQSAGLVVQLDSSNQINIVGVEIAGSVFAPTSTDLGNLVNEAETRGNLFLQQLSANAGIENFNLATVIIDDTTLTLILR